MNREDQRKAKQQRQQRSECLRLVRAASNSLSGLKYAFESEAAFRHELLWTAILIPITFVLSLPTLAKLMMVASIMLVLIVELANTAIETVVDRISTHRHPLSKKAKDIGSALVFLALLNAMMTWAVILVL